MFTGIVEGVRTVTAVRPVAGGAVLSVDLGQLAQDAKLGDSIAINGACLTISKFQGSVADFDVSAETLNMTMIDSIRPGTKVNAERAMAAGGRFGGHIVSGHVDGIGKVASIDRKGEFSLFKFSVDAKLLDEMILKGSVCVNGTSLTVCDIDDTTFSVAVIPTTLKDTTLGDVKRGDAVNIETDVIIKAVKKQLDKIVPSGSGLSIDKLKQMGF